MIKFELLFFFTCFKTSFGNSTNSALIEMSSGNVTLTVKLNLLPKNSFFSSCSLHTEVYAPSLLMSFKLMHISALTSVPDSTLIFKGIEAPKIFDSSETHDK